MPSIVNEIWNGRKEIAKYIGFFLILVVVASAFVPGFLGLSNDQNIFLFILGVVGLLYGSKE